MPRGPGILTWGLRREAGDAGAAPLLNSAPLPQPALTLATDKMDSAGGLWLLRSPWAQGGLRLLQTVRSGPKSRHNLSSSPSTLASDRAPHQKHEVLMGD